MAALDRFKTYTSELSWFTVFFGIVCLCPPVNAAEENSEGKFSSFVLNVEGITAANKQCEKTVQQYQQTMENVTKKLEDQEARIQELETTTREQAAIIQALNGKGLYNSTKCNYARKIIR